MFINGKISNIYILEYNKQVALETIVSLQGALTHKNPATIVIQVHFDLVGKLFWCVCVCVCM